MHAPSVYNDTLLHLDEKNCDKWKKMMNFAKESPEYGRIKSNF
jgi:hypothetical protein